MRKKLLLLVMMLAGALISTGCLQEAMVMPVGTVSGKVVVPAGKDPLGIQITVAGNAADINTYTSATGSFTLEFPKSGRYLLIAHSRNFDPDFAWVDITVEKTVTAPDIVLSEKVVGEGKWFGTIVDFPDATGFKIKSIDPKWATDTVKMYDDGTHGDKFANDGIYTLSLNNLPTGSQQYSLIWTGKNGDKEEMDPHRESILAGKSVINIREATEKLATGRVTSTLTGVNYAEIVLATKAGTRKIFLNSDGTYDMPMEGNGREYLVFRSPNFDIRPIPVNLSTMPLYTVPDVAMVAKAPNTAKFILIKSDFPDVTNPTLVADFTNWQPQAMYDDGTHGDDVAGDGAYTLTMTNVSPGYHKYAFNLSTTSQVRDPYEESGDSQYSILLVK
ncbi:MAG: carboxypeptidase regulatory-like domain-containing protein [Candidatus Riflebacteria bacterium]|nr:carboxypeptidase regulatory-like domain-containing protein [Candidatus Riflebacteria bacterium]